MPEMRSEEDELDRVQNLIRDEATRSREYLPGAIPGTLTPVDHDYDDVTVRISFDVKGQKVAEILQSLTSAQTVRAMSDADIAKLVGEWFEREAEKPIQIDYGPFIARVREMAGNAEQVLPPVAESWPKPMKTGDNK